MILQAEAVRGWWEEVECVRLEKKWGRQEEEEEEEEVFCWRGSKSWLWYLSLGSGDEPCRGCGRCEEKTVSKCTR
jgi:hypothetical protein